MLILNELWMEAEDLAGSIINNGSARIHPALGNNGKISENGFQGDWNHTGSDDYGKDFVTLIFIVLELQTD